MSVSGAQGGKNCTITKDGAHIDGMAGGGVTAAELAEARTSKPDGRYHADPAVATAARAAAKTTGAAVTASAVAT